MIAITALQENLKTVSADRLVLLTGDSKDYRNSTINIKLTSMVNIYHIGNFKYSITS